MQRHRTEDLLGVMSPVERKNAPEHLYLEGHEELLGARVRVSVVGTRRPSELGTKRAARLAHFLVQQGYVVVSGLAAGIDTVAHTVTINEGGNTIAVLGTGLDRAYPPENIGLLEEIKRDHLALSQFEAGKPFQPSFFPRRNRTMALLSHASVIVEAGSRSGTKHQGYEALRLGRPLFILRSVVESDDLDWPREMLDYGARVLSEPAELGELLAAAEPIEDGESAF